MASDEHSARVAIYTLAATIAVAALGIVGTQWAARTAFDAQMVQIGVNILSADPSKSDVAPAREWAIKLVEEHSGQAFSAQDRESLLHHPLDIAAAVKTIGSEGPMLGWKCMAFHKKQDGSWAPNSRDDPPVDGPVEKFLDTYCDAKAVSFGLQHFPFKHG
jgi:hypothetical protein